MLLPARHTEGSDGDTVQVSTRTVAMCAPQVLRSVIDALISKSHDQLHEALLVAVERLATDAMRAHPERERRTGRLQLGIVPVLEGRQVPDR